VRAVVLVGGEGTRLRPLTATTPKQMLPVAGRPIIEWVVDHLALHGVDEVVLSLGYRPDAFLHAYPDGLYGGVALRYAVEPEPLDTAGAIAFAADQAGVKETFVVANGDVLGDVDVGALVKFHRQRAAEATVHLLPVEDPSRFGVVVAGAEGRVESFVEKPPPGSAPSNLINAGTYVMEPSVLGRIPAGRRVSVERETFPLLVGEGTLYALSLPGSWTDVGTPVHYLEANLARGAADGPHPGVRRSVVGAGARLGLQAVIEGSVVMDGATVHDGAVVRDSIVGAGAVVGRGAVVSGLSVLGAGAEVPAGHHVTGARLPRIDA
jgi:mannose-1-phosphate guanylyltransferase